MSVMSDRWIRERALGDAMIEPFHEAQRRDSCISYGLSSYGYDARVADEFKIYARCGIIVNVTPLEPEWEGHVTLEFSNTTPLPAKIYANEGACQFLFLQGNEPCEVSYADRAGKYMGQRGVTLPRL
jgi:dCTP deaminase